MRRTLLLAVLVTLSCDARVGAPGRVFRVRLDEIGVVYRAGERIRPAGLEAALAGARRDPSGWIAVLHVHPETPLARVQAVAGLVHDAGVRDVRVVMDGGPKTSGRG